MLIINRQYFINKTHLQNGKDKIRIENDSNRYS